MNDKKINRVNLIGKNNFVIQYIDSEGNSFKERKSLNEFLFPHTSAHDEKIKGLELLLCEKERNLEKSEREKDSFFSLFKSKKKEVKRLTYEKDDLQKKIHQLEQSKAKIQLQLENYLLRINNKIIDVSNTLFNKSFQLFIEGDIDNALFLLRKEKLEENEEKSKVLQEELRKLNKQNSENRILNAKLLLFKGELAEAELNYQKAIKIYPSLENKFEYGEFLFFQNRRSKAREFFKDLQMNMRFREGFKADYGENWIAYENLLGAKIYYYTSLLIDDFTNERKKAFLELAQKNIDNVRFEDGFDYELFKDLEFSIILEDSYCLLESSNLDALQFSIYVLEDMKKKFEISGIYQVLRLKRLKANWYSLFGEIEKTNEIRKESLRLIEDHKLQNPSIELQIHEALFYIQLTYSTTPSESIEFIDKGIKLIQKASKYNEERYLFLEFKALCRKCELLFENNEIQDAISLVKEITELYGEAFSEDYPSQYDKFARIQLISSKCYFELTKVKDALIDVENSITNFNYSIELGKPKEYANEVFEAIYLKALIFISKSNTEKDRLNGIKTMLRGLSFIFKNDPVSERTKKQVNRCRKLLKSLGGFDDSYLDEMIKDIQEIAAPNKD